LSIWDINLNDPSYFEMQCYIVLIMTMPVMLMLLVMLLIHNRRILKNRGTCEGDSNVKD